MADPVTYTDPVTGKIIAYDKEGYDAYVQSNGQKQSSGFLGLRTLWNAVTDPLKKDKYILKKQQQSARDISYWEDYYTGCDAVVLIGDVWVDDIVTIQYSITNNKSPIYGYMSEEFDAVAKGTVIVQGQFVIAFKEVGYLPKILKEYENRRYEVPNERRISTIEQRIGSIENQFARIDRSIESSGLEQNGLVRADHFGYSTSPSGGKVNAEGFDIIAVYGNIGALRGGTIETINNVHITSKSLAVEPSGEPIAEVYSFFGRCVNKSLSNYSSYFDEFEMEMTEEESERLNEAQQELKVAKEDAASAFVISDRLLNVQFDSITGSLDAPNGPYTEELYYKGKLKYVTLDDLRSFKLAESKVEKIDEEVQELDSVPY